MNISKKIKDYFFSSPVFKLKANFAGQTAENNTYFVGGKAGPSYSLSNLLHEICHFAELEKERLLKFPHNGWGFYPGKFWQIGMHWGYEQRTAQQVEREARVWAFQISAERYFNLNDSAEDLVSSATWLPAWCFYKFSFKGKRSDKKALYYLANHVDRLSKRNSFEKLLNDFQERIQMLESVV
jgi:hypothetical protein